MTGIGIDETVILLDENGKRRRVKVIDRTTKVKGLGVVNLSKLIGAEYGDVVTLAGQELLIVRPSLIDFIETMERKAQIIIPKDAAYIVIHCGISSGCSVVEAGSGSGALALALASAVAPDGKLVSYDNRTEHQDVARRNVERAGLAGVVEWKVGDITRMVDERDADAFVLDIANPWDALDTAAAVLRPGGHLASYSPTANQVERVVRALRERGFKDVRAVEILVREMVVTEGGIRPNHEMLAHTGYIVTARWLGDRHLE